MAIALVNLLLVSTLANIQEKPKLCIDFSLWLSLDDQNCHDYEVRNYCNVDGTVGDGWNKEWGDIRDFSHGMSAFEACCACGGGYMPAPNDENLTIAYTPDLVCIDSPPDWRSTNHKSCANYEAEKLCNTNGEAGEGWNSEWGSLKSFDPADQKSSAQACCGCGGGQVVNREAFAIREASANAVLGCSDFSDWKNSDGQSCVDFALKKYCEDGKQGAGWHPEIWGSLKAVTSASGTKVTDACCACGGGHRLGGGVSEGTDNGDETSSPTYACVDNPLNWRDEFGDDCAVYTNSLYCDTTGLIPSSGLNTFGMNESAAQACCGCGGGRNVLVTADTDQDQLHQFCVNAPLGWISEENITCPEMRAYCLPNEAMDSETLITENDGSIIGTPQDIIAKFQSEDGIPATLACCTCGGGATDSIGLTIYFNNNMGSLFHHKKDLIHFERSVGDMILALFEDSRVSTAIFGTVGLLSSSMLGVKFNESRLENLSINEDTIRGIAIMISAYKFRFQVRHTEYVITQAHAGVVPVSKWATMHALSKSINEHGKGSSDDSNSNDGAYPTIFGAELILCVVLLIAIFCLGVYIMRSRARAKQVLAQMSTDKVAQKNHALRLASVGETDVDTVKARSVILDKGRPVTAINVHMSDSVA